MMSPRGSSAADFTDFIDKAKASGQMLGWYGDWAELSDPGAGPYNVAKLAEANGLQPLIVATFFTQGTGHLLRPFNDSVKNEYIAGAVAFASAYKPAYIGFGIEINSLHEDSPVDYDAFKAFFPEVAAAVKAASPGTKVFTVFQLERLRGLRGGLFGGTNDQGVNDWALLGDFPDTDLLAFTTYPCLVYRDPSDLPTDYYSAIANYTSKPVAFSEAVWFRSGPAGWESSESEEARFVADYIALTKPLGPKFLIWSFLYDQEAQAPFDSMGLLSISEGTSPAWEAWLTP